MSRDPYTETSFQQQGATSDPGVPGLVRLLVSDSKRLISDEARLARLELGESVRVGARGVLWLSLAFGVGVIALGALTIALATGLGALFNGHVWLGALVTGIVEITAAVFLIRGGIRAFAKPPYSLPETRESLKDTAAWIAARRGD